MGSRDCRVYCGNLPPDVRTSEVEDLFSKYGKINYVDLKNGRRPPFAFIDFEDTRDAEDAVKNRDGYDYDGYRLRVEFIRGVGPRGPGGRPLSGEEDRGGSRGSQRDRDGGRGGDRGRGAPPPYRSNGGGGGGPPSGGRRTNYRVTITGPFLPRSLHPSSGLPASGSWQDLKDHMRAAGDVCYADVFRDGTGVVEYERLEDMKYALKKLDDTKFRSHEVDKKEASSAGGGRDRSRSPVGGRRGSPSYSPRRSRSRSANARRAGSDVSRSRSRS